MQSNEEAADRSDSGHQNCTGTPQFNSPQLTRPLADEIYLVTCTIAQGCRATKTPLLIELQRSLWHRFRELHPVAEVPLWQFIDQLHQLHHDVIIP